MKWVVALVAMIVIGVLEWSAMNHGINGTVFTFAIAAIAGLGGYMLKGIAKR